MNFLECALLLATGSTFFADVNGFTIVTTTQAELTSCTSGEPQLPNLSYARLYSAYPQINFTCDYLAVDGFNETFTFYYYENYTGSCSNINTVKGTVAFTTVLNTRKLGSNIGIDINGKFITGPYINMNVVSTLVYPSVNLLECNSTIGMEALSGLLTLAIAGGPTCNGITYKTYCPGIHFASTQDATVTVPLPGSLEALLGINLNLNLPPLGSIGLNLG